jgi:hypothetical protein
MLSEERPPLLAIGISNGDDSRRELARVFPGAVTGEMFGDGVRMLVHLSRRIAATASSAERLLPYADPARESTLYPTEDSDATEAIVNIADPMSAATRARVALRPVVIPRLLRLLRELHLTPRERRTWAEALVLGTAAE